MNAIFVNYWENDVDFGDYNFMIVWMLARLVYCTIG